MKTRTGPKNTRLMAGLLIMGALTWASTQMGCNKGRLVAVDSAQSQVSVTDTFIAALTGPLTDSERGVTLTKRISPASSARPLLSAVAKPQASPCPGSRFTPALNTVCGGDLLVLVSYAACAVGPNNESLMNGTTSLRFDSQANCDGWLNNAIPVAGSVTWTVNSLMRQTTDGGKVTTSTIPAANYLGTTVGGGVVTSFGSPSSTVNILGMQKIRTGDGAAYNHLVRTTAPLIVTGSKENNNRVIVSGTVAIDDNGTEFTASGAITNLTWVRTCCYPVGGTVAWTFAGAVTGTASMDFNTGTCGNVSVTGLDKSTGIQKLQGCE